MTDSVTVRAAAATYRGLSAEDDGALFAGIPFAQPPIGELRFRPPQPLPDAAGEVDATRFRAAPAQKGTATLSKANPAAVDQAAPSPVSSFAAMAAATNPPETSEDCLYLNVWTPDVDASLPVIVWFYGGGFEVGSAAPPVTDGAALARAVDAVVVSVNYRVGALGFAHWAGVGGPQWAQSSNLGLQDQLAGLEWVRRNIAAFGGDPANVTVAGESAGAFCIGALLGIPHARDLFDKAILSSGSAGRVFSTAIADEIAQALLDAVGVPTVEELQRVDVDRILAVQQEAIDSDIGVRNLPGGRSWGVVLDGVVLPEDPLEAVRRGAAASIPVLVGANRDETLIFRVMGGAGFAPADEGTLVAELAKASAEAQELYRAYRERLGADADLGAIRSAFLSDAVYRRPASSLAAAQREGGGSAWTYLFSATPMPAVGAFHGVDLVFTFDHLEETGLSTPELREVRDSWLGSWARFIATGDPGWAPYDPRASENTRSFGGGAELTTEPPHDAVLATWPLP